MAEIVLTKEQQAVIDNRGGTLLVSAAAGSGKTKVLIDRVLKRVSEGHNIDEYLLITFTKAAASELRGKMILQLSELLSKDPENRHLQRQMNRVYLTQISTVHSFCAAVLRQYAHNLDIPADFRTLEEQEGEILQSRAMKNMLDGVYRSNLDNEEIASALTMLGAGRNDSTLPQMILKVYDSIECWVDPKERIAQLRQSLCDNTWHDPIETLWGKYLFDEMQASLHEYISQLERAKAMAYGNAEFEPYLMTFEADIQLLQGLCRAQTWEELRQLPATFRTLKQIRKCGDPDLKERLKKLRDKVKADFNKRMKVFVITAEDLHEELWKTGGAIGGLLTLVELYAAEYRKEKMRRHVLDYGDLEHETLRLLRSNRTAAREIGDRFDEVMVDEYQDTNALQDAIFGAIAYKGNLFMVGDVKQSIYRFRMADPTGFLNRYKTYAEYSAAKDGEPRKILLSDNFRSCPEVLGAANDVFRLLMTERVGGLQYGDAEALRPNLSEHGEHPIELHCIDLADMNKEALISKHEIEAEFIARRIKKMLTDGEMIHLREKSRKIEPEDIAILMRSMKHAPTYIAALNRHGIRCVSSNENFLDSEEMCVMLSLLKVVDNPYQDIPLLSVLFSPIFGMSADEVALLKVQVRDKELYDTLKASERGMKIADMICRLRDLAGQVNVHTLIDYAEEMLCLRALYPHCEQNFDRMLELADAYDRSGGTGLSDFLRHLELKREKGIKVDVLSKKGAVCMMTMHKSKGLEFPVVFLGGLSNQFNFMDLLSDVLIDDKLGIGTTILETERYTKYSTVVRNAISDRIKKENKSEEMRILYVAMTRAKCRLIMSYCASNTAKKLERIATDMTVPPLDTYIRSAQSLGDWILMSAMTRTEAGELFAVAGYSAERTVSEHLWKIRYHTAEKLLPQEMGDADVRQTMRDIPEYCEITYPYLPASAHPSKITATQLKGKHSDDVLAQDIGFVPQLRYVKPRFDEHQALTPTERGTAIHLAMEHLRYDSCTSASELEDELTRLVALRHMTKAQADAVPRDKLLRFFSSELGKRILMAKEVRREFKFSVLVDAADYQHALQGEEVMLQGVADCFLIEEDGIVLIDFKSDRIGEHEISERAEHYRGQLDAYSRAISSIFELPVKERILYFFAIDRAVII